MAPRENSECHETVRNDEVQLSNLLCLLNTEVDGNGVLNATAGRGYYDRIAHRISHSGARSWSTGTASGDGQSSSESHKE